jgi:hypothetical protein
MCRGPFVFYDGIFERRESHAPNDESGVLQKIGTFLYTSEFILALH